MCLLLLSDIPTNIFVKTHRPWNNLWFVGGFFLWIAIPGIVKHSYMFNNVSMKQCNYLNPKILRTSSSCLSCLLLLVSEAIIFHIYHEMYFIKQILCTECSFNFSNFWTFDWESSKLTFHYLWRYLQACMPILNSVSSPLCVT